MLQHPPYRVGGENRFFTYELLVCPYHTRTIHSTFDPRTGERDNWIEIQECIVLLFFSSSLPSIQPAAAVSGVGWPFGFIPELLSRSGIFTHLRSIDSDCVLIGRVRYIKRLIYTAILLAPPTEICLFLLSNSQQDAQLIEVVNWKSREEEEEVEYIEQQNLHV